MNEIEIEKMVRFAKERLHSEDIPTDELRLTQLCSAPFCDMRHESDFYSMGVHKASERHFTRDWFIGLHALNPNANSFLELGAGSGYILRVALKLGYDAVGVEISEWHVNAAKKSLEHFGYDSSRVVHADFLSDDFLKNGIADKQIKDYDVVHLWTVEKVVFSALPVIVPQMRKDALIITGFEQPFYPEDIAGLLARKNVPATFQAYRRGMFLLKRD